MLEAIDEAAPSRLEYDALAGPGAPPVAEWSPSRLETLGACPQQYFFRHILRVEEMDEIAEPYELDAREMGLAVHAVLADVYGRLFGAPDALREGLDPARAASRALELLREAWAARTADIAERMHGRYPLLWSETSRLYRNALETFVLFDAPSLARDRGALLGVESPVRGTIAPDSGSPAIAVRGRIDRVTRDGAGGIVVADFKTGRDLEGHVAMRGLLKGRRLQMALYALLAEASRAGWGGGDRAIAVEVIGIGPEHAGGIEPPAEDEPRGYPARAALDPKKFLECREGILETIGVLAKLAASGFFPLDPASERCRYCPYARACRRSHAPTLARLRAAPPAADFYRLRGKSTRARTLADVKDAEGDET